jgi:F-type H+-transporting ATPase subunit delta
MRHSKRIGKSARQLFRLCLADGRLDTQRAQRVAQHLVSSGRRRGLSVLSAFERLVRLYRDRHAAVVESAVPLSEDARVEVLASLARIYGPGLEASFEDNPALIGGMRIKVGSDVYDGSVQAKLARLRQGFGEAGAASR